MNFKYTEYRKVGRKINYDKNYSINSRLNIKTKRVSEKERHTIKSQMSLCRLDTYVDPCP